jgi:hypothetical protein
MKKLVLFGLLFLLAIPAVAQLGTTRFFTSDSMAVSTTKRDTTFSTERYESCNILFSGCDGLIRVATSTQDTVGWTNTTVVKRFFLVPELVPFKITANSALGIVGLYRLDFGAVTGTGIMYIIGTKKVAE